MDTPTRIVDQAGNVHWELADGTYHRIDGPASERDDGTLMWFVHDKAHRAGGPAYISTTMSEWYDHGRRHRIDGPARTDKVTGTTEWYLYDRVLEPDDVERFEQTPVGDRDLIAQLFCEGTPMADAIAAAARIR